ncbi:hypothetical protein ACIP4U_30325 [Streptomyces caelestis]
MDADVAILLGASPSFSPRWAIAVSRYTYPWPRTRSAITESYG